MTSLAFNLLLLGLVIVLAILTLFLLAPALSWWASRERKSKRRGGYLL